MSFEYEYTVQFRDTDAAGVVYFANILTFCHLAYENSLIQAGIDLNSLVTNSEFAIPITHTAADFLRPMFCGDRLLISLTPQPIGNNGFEINYQILAPISSSISSTDTEKSRLYARALTKHILIHPRSRKRQELPPILHQWLAKFADHLSLTNIKSVDS